MARRIIQDNTSLPVPSVTDIDWTDPSKIPADELVGFIEGHYEEAGQRNMNWRKKALERLAWCRGDQELRWDDEKRDLVVESMENEPVEFRRPITINRLRGFVMSYLSMNFGRPLTWEVTPLTMDDEDVSGARVAEKLLRYYFSGQRTITRMLDAAWMIFVTGINFAKPIWDPGLGEVDVYPDEVVNAVLSDAPEGSKVKRGLKKLFGRGKRTAEGLQVPQGAPFLDWCTPFEVSEPENCRRVSEAGWLIQSRWRSVEYVRTRYPEEGHDVVAEQRTDDFYFRHQARYGNYHPYSGETRSTTTEADEVLVHEFWRPVSPGAPVGCLAVTTRDRILKVGPHPYKHGKIPLVDCREQPEDEYFLPSCTIKDGMGIQQSINRTRSEWQGHLSCTMNPKMLEDHGSHVPDDALTGGPKRIVIKPGARFEPLQYPSLPVGTYELDKANHRDLEDVCGVHRSTSGRPESSQQSGKHAELMKQGDRQRQAVPRLLLQDSFSEIGAQFIALLWQYADKKRTLSIPPAGALPGEMLTFTGKELLRKPPVGASFPNVTAILTPDVAMEETVGKLTFLQEGGWITPESQQDKMMVLRALGDDRPGQWDPVEEHRAVAREEHRQMLEGKYEGEDVNLGDDDAIHIAEHLRFTTTERFRMAKRKNAMLGVVMAVHIRTHEWQMADKELRQEAIRAKVKGDLAQEMGLVKGGGGGGAPSGVAPAAPGMAPPGMPGMVPPGSPPRPGRLNGGPAGVVPVSGPGIRSV